MQGVGQTDWAGAVASMIGTAGKVATSALTPQGAAAAAPGQKIKYLDVEVTQGQTWPFVVGVGIICLVAIVWMREGD
jgi:hypothetical protein